MSENGDGHVDGFDDGENIDDNDIVTLVDEDGDEHDFVVLAIVELDDQQYAMLAPLEQVDDEENPELELFLFTYEETEEGANFGEIPDDETYERVQEYCAKLLDTDAADEEEEEDEA